MEGLLGEFHHLVALGPWIQTAVHQGRRDDLKPEGRRHNSNPNDVGCAPVVIEDNVWLGANVTVLKGVRIGRDSVVAAGSVVTRDLPAGVLAAGVPAKVIKDLKEK